ncbi:MULTISPECIES: hypothetical protein [Acidiphilium]|jgi:hypothetical protein|uniref:hypothetical protein n=1 Tax=Acidiphilium TaxID=522 RepID=UPI000214569C|nr:MULTISPECIES: hypothetical protein [Acidiphilium]MBU6355514.1 hypothetical protein [Rhodospirillales bacterium]EGO96195.1 hypothetical protein APM_0946 [Acidiphilium sp. PM]KDM66499.1 hypothetical protein ACIDI_60c00060 [Acidiphilium sp. JA12-A1]MBS3023902.1 hypothetical protein [Acidiphilium multivorum]MDE2327193.1 hypothetical protein [Rhodospirillales bacterium]
MRKSRLIVLVTLAGAAALLAGCASNDPFAQPGNWHENDAPMHNIAVELVNPHDLVGGHGDASFTGPIAETAVGKALKSSSSSSTSGAAGSAGGGGTSLGGAGGGLAASSGGMGGSGQ